MFRVTLNFRDDISALQLHHFEGWSSFKGEKCKNTRSYVAFVLRSPNKQNRAARKKQQKAFRF